MAATTATKEPVATSSLDLHRKYEQTTILLCTNYLCTIADQMPHYWLTTKPAFDKIDTELFAIVDVNETFTEGGACNSLGPRVLNDCFTIPIVHRAPTPTLREVLDQIPDAISHVPGHPMVYLYIRALPYTIGAPGAPKHFSRLICTVQTGTWSQPASDGSREGIPFDPTAKFNAHNMKITFPRTPMAPEELDRRLTFLTEAKKESTPEDIAHGLVSISDRLVAGQRYKYAERIGIVQVGTMHLILPDGTIARFVAEIHTFHRYGGYYGFFRPSIAEVAEQMPAEFFTTPAGAASEVHDDCGAPHYLIATNMASPNAWDMIIGEFHVGATTIWDVRGSFGGRAAPTRELLAAPILRPIADPVAPEATAAAAPLVLASRSAPVSPKAEPDRCMICLDVAPDTMVLPCGHIVVCAACSRKLQSSHDACICVQCRRAIEEVCYP